MAPINDSGPTKVPRTKRGFFNKVRTGCLTCKIRKVKCDEAKPHCQRCIKSGRKCDGYRAGTSTPDSDPSLDPLVPWQPGALFASDAERRSFYYFQSHACKALGGHFNLSFWGREVMQAAIHYRPIRHLVVALGAAYESFQAGDGPGKGTPGMELALQQCNHSIKQLAAVPAQPSGTQSPETISCVLTASLLFIYLAMIRGHLAEAIQHVQSAIKLLHLLDNTPQKPATSTTPKYPIPPSQLRTLLTSIYGQLRAMINSTAPHHPNNPNKKNTNNKNTHDTTDLLLTPTLPPPPQAYLSLPQAHASIESLFHNTLSFLQSSDLNPPTTPTALQALVTRHRELCALLEGSQDALDVLANSLSQDGDSEERKGVAILRVYHLLMVVRLRIDVFRPEEREAGFDGVEGYLEEMLRLCEVVVGEGAEDGEGKNGNGEGEGKMKKKKKVVCVSSGLGVVMPLHMIAARCRNGRVRRRAVELLVGCGRREGLWDAGLAGEVVRRTVEIEEGGCDGVEGWEEGDGRVREVKIELRGEREAVARFVRVGDWKRGLRGREEVIAW